MIFRLSRLIFASLMFFFLYTSHSAANATGTLEGTVTDRSTGSPLAAASVFLRGTSFGTSTNLDGKFRITSIPPGSYAVQVNLLGYEPLVRTDIVITPARPALLNFELESTTLALEEIEFTAGFFEKDSDFKVSSIVQSNEEIRRLPGGFEDVVRAISVLPGIAQIGPARNDLIVRGGAPSENLFRIDGFEVPNINHFGSQGTTGGPQSFINLDFIDRTTFSAGGFGVRYGDKLSSIMDIVLREGRRDNLGGKATIAATQFGLNLEGPLPASDGSFLFSARRSYLDLIFKANGFGFVPEYWDFLFKADASPSPVDQISVLGIAALDNVRLFNDTKDQRYSNSRIPDSDQTLSLLGARWKHLFGKGFAHFSVSQIIQTYDIEQLDSTRTQLLFRNNATESETAFKGEVIWKPTRTNEVTLGIQQKLVNFENELRLPPFTTSYGEVLQVSKDNQSTSFKTGGYAQLSSEWEPIRATFGLRSDYFELLENGFSFTPRFSLNYAFNRLTSTSMSVGRYAQFPSYVWLVGSTENKKLKPLYADQLVLGVDRILRSDVRLSLEGFYKNYFNYPTSETRPYLVLANTGAQFGGTQDEFSTYGLDNLVSKGKGWARGIELFAQKKAAESPHYATVSLTYSETRFTALDGIERPGTFDQRWLLNVGGGFIFNQKLETSFRFRLATGSPYTPYNLDGTRNVARYNSERTPLNHSLDVRADRRWFFDNWTLIGYIDIQNIYNNPFKAPPEWNEREQRTLETSSIGLLPSIGLSFEF